MKRTILKCMRCTHDTNEHRPARQLLTSYARFRARCQAALHTLECYINATSSASISSNVDKLIIYASCASISSTSACKYPLPGPAPDSTSALSRERSHYAATGPMPTIQVRVFAYADL
jgi:hypothetical protein